MVPMVAAEATEDPDVAENSAQDAMLVCSRPPGIQRTHLSSAWNIAPAMPEPSKSSPVRMKSGTATRAKLVDPPQRSSPTAGATGKNE